MMGGSNGLGMGLGNLARVSRAKTRSISAGNLAASLTLAMLC